MPAKGEKLMVSGMTTEQKTKFLQVSERLWAGRSYRKGLNAMVTCALLLRDQMGSWEKVAEAVANKQAQ